MIMQNIWENLSNRNIFKIRIEKHWGRNPDRHSQPDILPSEDEISHAKGLGEYRGGCMCISFMESTIVLETRGILDTKFIDRLAEDTKEKLINYLWILLAT